MSNIGEVTDIDQLPIKTISYGPLSFEQEQVKARTTRFRWMQLSKIPSSNPGRLYNPSDITQTHSIFANLSEITFLDIPKVRAWSIFTLPMP